MLNTANFCIVEPETQIDSLMDRYQSIHNENFIIKRAETCNLQDEAICEGEINKEELPSFHISKNIHRMSSVKE